MLKDLTEEQRKVFHLINNLTDNEDDRQDLWIHYLAGNSTSFSEKLTSIAFDREQESKLRSLVWQLMTSEDYKAKKVQDVIESLTDLERSILACFLIDLDVEQISELKDISPIRINQVVSTIRYNSRWESLWSENVIKASLQR